MKAILSLLLIVPFCAALQRHRRPPKPSAEVKALLNEVGGLLYGLTDEEIQTNICDTIDLSQYEDAADSNSELDIDEVLAIYADLFSDLGVTTVIDDDDAKYLFFLIDKQIDRDGSITQDEVCSLLPKLRDAYIPDSIRALYRSVKELINSLSTTDLLCYIIEDQYGTEFEDGLTDTEAQTLLEDLGNLTGYPQPGDISTEDFNYLFDKIDEDDNDNISIEELCNTLGDLVDSDSDSGSDSDSD